MKGIFIYLFAFVIILLIILVLFMIKIGNKNEIQKDKENTKIIFENGKEIYVEIADSEAEWGKGLMFRKSLDKNNGMFFIFDDSVIRYFWMKNTYIPLDIIFIDENFTIVNIAENVPVCVKEPCENYQSLKPVKYVLEVNAGFSKENELKSGYKLLYFQ